MQICDLSAPPNVVADCGAVVYRKSFFCDCSQLLLLVYCFANDCSVVFLLWSQ